MFGFNMSRVDSRQYENHRQYAANLQKHGKAYMGENYFPDSINFTQRPEVREFILAAYLITKEPGRTSAALNTYPAGVGESPGPRAFWSGDQLAPDPTYGNGTGNMLKFPEFSIDIGEPGPESRSGQFYERPYSKGLLGRWLWKFFLD